MDRICERRLIPVSTVHSEEEGLRIAEALLAGGLDIVEFTFRTEAALATIKRVVEEMPNMCVGAGTVLSADQLEQAISAGIKFAVAPGLNGELVTVARDAGVEFVPGVVTATEVDKAITSGCHLLKFFPAEAMGGAAAVKAVGGPFAHTGVKFVPTGGVNESNAPGYLRLPVVAAVAGSWMVRAKLVEEQKWDEITRLTREAMEMVGEAGA